jgi:hypothetical protein
MKLTPLSLSISILIIFFASSCSKDKESDSNYIRATINGTTIQVPAVISKVDLGGGAQLIEIDGFFGNDQLGLVFNNPVVQNINFRMIQVNPATLLTFTSENFESGHKLLWATSSETNVAKFIIQITPDGTNWTDIDSVNATGPGNYSKVIYNNLGVGHSCYYRLKITDTGGSFQYSMVRVMYDTPPAFYKPAGDYPRRGYNGNLEIVSVDQNRKIMKGHFYFKMKTSTGQLYDITNGEFSTAY